MSSQTRARKCCRRPWACTRSRNYGISRYIPEPEAMQRSYAAIYELLGEPVRALLAATHLRRH